MTEELFAADAYVRSCQATVVENGDEGVILDRTVFYARSGGQPGDTGVLRWEDGEVRVLDTLKLGGRLLHEVDGGPPAPGIDVTAEIGRKIELRVIVHLVLQGCGLGCRAPSARASGTPP